MLRLASLLLLILGFRAHAGIDPSIDWKVLRTAHFEIIYDERYKALADHYARYAEYSYENLRQVFSEMPSGRTIVVLDDSTDVTNGYATFLPYPMIRAYPTLPNALDSISYYESWALELMVHEYTHILTFQPSHGFYTPLKYLFGTIVRPNAVLPRWWQEGLAVEMESRYTLRGRLRSPGTSAALRALALENKLDLETVDRINESSIPTFPFGQRPYLIGSLVLHEIASQSTPATLDYLLQRYSRRVPFFLSAPLQEKLNRNYVELLTQIYTTLQQKAKADQKRIQDAGEDKIESFEHSGTGQISPAISPDGKYLAYVAYEPFGGGEIRLIERDVTKKESFKGKEYRVLRRGKGFVKVSWMPDSKHLVYDKLDYFKRRLLYRDLYEFDIEEKEEQRLTEGARSQEPSVSPSGKMIAFVQFENQQTQLAVFYRQTGQVKVLFKPPSGSRISRPEFLDDERLVFSGQSPQNGTERLYMYNLESKQRTALLEDFPVTGQARKTAKGVLFTSHRTGVSNLYLADDLFTRARALTNTTTEVANGEFDPVRGELITSRLTADGRKLFVSRNVRTFEPPAVDGVNRQDFQLKSRSLGPPEIKTEERGYHPIRYLLPRYWIPFVYPIEGGMLMQGSTANSDPLEKNLYVIEGSYDSVTKKGSYGLAYTNSSTPLDLNIAFAEYNEYLGASDETLTSRSTSASAAFFLPWLSYHWRGLLGGVNIETELVGGSIERQGPKAGFVYSNFDADEGTFQGGWKFEVAHTEYLEGENRLDYGHSYAALSTKLNHPLPARHSFTFQLKGANAPHLPLAGVVAFGDKTLGANYFVNLINSTFLVRGYPSGTFAGRKMVNVNLDYGFPLSDYFHGWGLKPLFLRNLSGNIFVDAVELEGKAYDIEQEAYLNVEMNKQFYSTGLELNLNSTVAYHLPLSFTLGLYYAFDKEAGGGFMPFFGIGYSGIDGIDLKRHQGLRTQAYGE